MKYFNANKEKYLTKIDSLSQKMKAKLIGLRTETAIRVRIMAIKSIEMLRINSSKITLFLWNDLTLTKNKYLPIFRNLSKAAITLIGVFLSVLFYLLNPELKDIIAKSDLFYVSAGLIGTILALTFSLSALPIQKAAEKFGGTITFIYRRDKSFKLIFITLATLCLLSIFLGVLVTKINNEHHLWLILFEVLILSTALDLIRVYNERSNSFLSPREGILRLSKLAQKQFSRHNSRIKQYSKIYKASLPNESLKHLDDGDVEKFIYQNNKNAHALKYYSFELFEMANRAVISKQTYVATQALSEITNLSTCYLSVYKDGFVIKPASLMVATSDANDAISPIMEGLQDLIQLSIRENDELTCKHTIQAIGVICSSILIIESQIKGHYDRSINWLSLGYLENAVADSIKNGLIDAGMEGIRVFNRLIETSPKAIDQISFLNQAIRAQGNFCKEYIKTNNFAISEYAINGLMRILKFSLDIKLPQRSLLWDYVIRELKIVIPAAIIFSLNNRSIENSPMDSAHSVVKELSIPHLLNEEMSSCEVDESRPHCSPYSTFLDLSDKVRQYLRHISDEYDLGQNRFLLQLIQLVDNISDIFLFALANPLREDRIDERELVNKLIWHLLFLSNAFSKKKIVPHYYADMAAKIAAKNGLSAYKADIWELDSKCRQIIISITISLIEKKSASNQSKYLIDEELECLCLFKIAAERKNDEVTINSINGEISSVIEYFSKYHEKNAIQDRFDDIESKVRTSLEEPNYGHRDDKLIAIVQGIEPLNDDPTL